MYKKSSYNLKFKNNINTVWLRSQIIKPEMVGYSVQVHKGNGFINLKITEAMVGHKFGEFAPTRVKYIYKKKK